VGFKLAEGKGLREGWDSKELWKSVERSKAPRANPTHGHPLVLLAPCRCGEKLGLIGPSLIRLRNVQPIISSV
jgi:hypothetical protein